MLPRTADILGGMQVVDNSSAFRMTEGVPLVIPEVNADALKGVTKGKGGIVANPNCSTIIALMAVTPLHRLAKVKRMVVSTYQVRHFPSQSSSWQHLCQFGNLCQCGSHGCHVNLNVVVFATPVRDRRYQRKAKSDCRFVV